MIGETENLRPVHEGRSFISERLFKTGISREQSLLKAANIVERNFLVSLQYDWETGQPVKLTEIGLKNWFTNLDNLGNSGASCLCGLLDHPSDPTVILQWRQSPSRRPKKERIECTIPHNITLDSLLTLFSQFNPDFQALHSYVYHFVLLQLHGRAMRKYKQALAKRRPEEHQYICIPQPFEGVSDTLPPLLLAYEFDCLRVPEGIWWVNYWSPLQVETVGIERIRAAEWERLIELPNGGVTVAVTADPLDVTNSDHMNKLGKIVKQLNLRELQEQHLVTH